MTDISVFDKRVTHWADKAIAEARKLHDAGGHYDFDAIAEAFGG